MMLTSKWKERAEYLNSIPRHERNIRESIVLAKEHIRVQMDIIRDEQASSDEKIAARQIVIKEQWLIKQLTKKLPHRYPDNIVKRCPFCRSNDIDGFGPTIEGENYRDKFFIKCMSCGAQGGSADDLIDALHLWNNRKEG